MLYRISEYDGEDVRATETGEHDLPEQPTVRDIVDAVSQINSGCNADEFCDGRDPYDGDLVETVDGWLVVSSNGEGSLYLIHATPLD